MADELQALLDRLDRDGIRKGENEAARIVEEAKAEAKRIVEAANEEAQRLTAAAKAQCATMQQKTEAALRQSARQVLLEVRHELEERVKNAVAALLRSVMDPGAVAECIARLCLEYFRTAGANDSLTVLLPADRAAVLAEAVKAQLADDLHSRVNLAPSPELSGGFKLAFSGNDVVYDFSDEALVEALSAHLSGSVAGVLTAK